MREGQNMIVIFVLIIGAWIVSSIYRYKVLSLTKHNNVKYWALIENVYGNRQVIQVSRAQWANMNVGDWIWHR